jgi:hypothetical protein
LVNRGDCAIAHNGTIFEGKTSDRDSDSIILSRYVSQLPRNWYKNPAILTLFNEYVGKNNRVAILTHENKAELFNRPSWFAENNDMIFYSSDYYRRERFVPQTTTSVITTGWKDDHTTDSFVFEFCLSCGKDLIEKDDIKEGYCKKCLTHIVKTGHKNIYDMTDDEINKITI